MKIIPMFVTPKARSPRMWFAVIMVPGQDRPYMNCFASLDLAENWMHSLPDFENYGGWIFEAKLDPKKKTRRA